MSTNTFDRPLIITKDEDVEYFWKIYNNIKPKPLPLHKNFLEEMDEVAELFKQKVESQKKDNVE